LRKELKGKAITHKQYDWPLRLPTQVGAAGMMRLWPLLGFARLRRINVVRIAYPSSPAARGIDPFYTDCITIVRWKRRLNMLLISTMGWIVIGVAVVILAVFIGMKIKDKYF
jgi:hypothetical protein